jgi:stress response protein SCP2
VEPSTVNPDPTTLKPGQFIRFTDKDGSFPEISLTLQWKPANASVWRELQELYRHGSTSGDLDLSAIAHVATVRGIVTGTNRHWGPIRHSGDNLTGHRFLLGWLRNKPGQEILTINLADLNPSTSVVFTITSNAYLPISRFPDVQCDLSIRLGDPDDSEDSVLHTLETGVNEYDTAAIMAKLSYQDNAWVLEAVRDTGLGHTAQDLLDNHSFDEAGEDFPNPTEYF